jgi:hypothetical protein
MNNKEEKETQETKLKGDDNLAKIAISKDADRGLVEILGRISDGFEAGRATKQDVASHIIMRFVSACSEKEIHDMRSLFFNPILLMEATLKKAKETGVLSEALRNILFEQFLAAEPQPNAKRIKKSLNSNIIKDNVAEDRGLGEA